VSFCQFVPFGNCLTNASLSSDDAFQPLRPDMQFPKYVTFAANRDHLASSGPDIGSGNVGLAISWGGRSPKEERLGETTGGEEKLGNDIAIRANRPRIAVRLYLKAQKIHRHNMDVKEADVTRPDPGEPLAFFGFRRSGGGRESRTARALAQTRDERADEQGGTLGESCKTYVSKNKWSQAGRMQGAPLCT
jgi:hypothetical protein